MIEVIWWRSNSEDRPLASLAPQTEEQRRASEEDDLLYEEYLSRRSQ